MQLDPGPSAVGDWASRSPTASWMPLAQWTEGGVVPLPIQAAEDWPV